MNQFRLMKKRLYLILASYSITIISFEMFAVVNKVVRS